MKSPPSSVPRPSGRGLSAADPLNECKTMPRTRWGSSRGNRMMFAASDRLDPEDFLAVHDPIVAEPAAARHRMGVALVFADEIEGKVANHREVFGSVVGAGL